MILHSGSVPLYEKNYQKSNIMIRTNNDIDNIFDKQNFSDIPDSYEFY